MNKRRRRFLVLPLLAALGAALPGVGSQAALMPAYAAEETQTIRAVDYGADPSGIRDSTTAIQDALQAAKELREQTGQPVTLEFEKGEYAIYKDKAAVREIHTSNTSSTSYPQKTIGLLIEEQNDLCIEGNGSLFMMHGNMMALAITHSKNITLHDFSWDFAVPTTSEMTVSAMYSENGKDVTEFYIPKCFPYTLEGTTLRWTSEVSPYTGQYYWTKTGIHENTYAISAQDTTGEFTRRFGTGSESPFTSLQSITPVEGSDGTILKFVYNSSRPSIQKVGMVFEFNSAAVRETAGALIWESENVTSRKVNVHYMHGFGWLLQMAKDIYFYDCSIKPRTNSGHITASYADGIHASGAAGEIVIENCSFASLHDDPINIHGTFTRAEEKIDAHTLKLKYIHAQQGGFPQFHVGDQVQFFSRDYLQSADNEKQYTVAEIISNPGEDGNDLKTMVVRFEESLPDYLSETVSGEPKYVAENVTYTPKVTIRNNTFRDLAARAILCTTRKKVLIENNTFYNTSMATIYLSNDSNNWYESGPIRDMTIRNNTFFIKDTGERSWAYRPAIYVNPVTKNGGLPDYSTPIHKNLTIEDNVFYMSSDTVLKAESVENLTFSGNTVLRTDPQIRLSVNDASSSLTLSQGASAQAAVSASGLRRTGNSENIVELTKSKHVVISNNTYDDGQKLYACYEGMPESEISIENDALTKSAVKTGEASSGTGEIHYLSDHPDIAQVDASGTIRAIAPGKANIYAWTDWNGSKITSEPICVRVENESSELEIENGEPYAYAKADSISLSLSKGTADSWSVSALDGSSVEGASISSEGVMRAPSGIYRVSAHSGSSSASILVLLDTQKSNGLTALFDLVNREDDSIELSETSITQTLIRGDVYQDSNNIHNMITYDLPSSASKENFATAVHISGLPARESSQWDSANLFLYEDADNYLSIGKKSHFSGFATVREVNGSATETGGNSAQDAQLDAWFGFVRSGSTAKACWSLDGENWREAAQMDASILENPKIAMYGWATNLRSKQVTYSDFRFASGCSSMQDLMETDVIPFMGGSAGSPVIRSMTLEADETNPLLVRAQAQVESDEASGLMRYLYTYTDPSGAITNTLSESASWTAPGSGTVSVSGLYTSPAGFAAKPITSASISLKAPQSDTLSSVSLNSSPVWSEGENAGSAQNPLVVSVPSIAGKALLETEGASGKWMLNGETQSGSSAVLSMDESSPLQTISDGTHTIYLRLEAAKDSSCAIESLSIDDAEVQANSFMRVSSRTLQLQAQAQEKSSLSLYQARNAAPLVSAQAGQTLECDLELENGINSFILESAAEDGISSERRVFHLFYIPSTDASIESLTLDGSTLRANEPVSVDADSPLSLLALEIAPQAKAAVLLNGKPVSLNKQNTALLDSILPGRNELQICVTAEDGASKTQQSYTLFKKGVQSADLYSLSVDGKSLDPEASQWSAYTSEDSAEVRVASVDPDATVFLSDGIHSISGCGSANLEASLFEDSHRVSFRIVSADGSLQKSGEIDIVKAAFLSDLQWDTSSTVGYGSIQKDRSSSGGAISIINDAGKEVVFERGIGTHADTNILFNLPAGTYIGLSGAVGVDAAQRTSQYPHIVFKIQTDGQDAFTSSTMYASTPYEEFSVDLRNVSALRLIATQTSNNYSAHADFANCRLDMAYRQKADSTLSLDGLIEQLSLLPSIPLNQAAKTSVAAWQTAVASGGDLLLSVFNGDSSMTQTQIDQAAENIRTAREAIEKKGEEQLNYAMLLQVINSSREVISRIDDFSTGSASGFAEAYKEAEALLNHASSQAEINTKTNDLHQRLLLLRLSPARGKLDLLAD